MPCLRTLVRGAVSVTLVLFWWCGSTAAADLPTPGDPNPLGDLLSQRTDDSGSEPTPLGTLPGASPDGKPAPALDDFRSPPWVDDFGKVPTLDEPPAGSPPLQDGIVVYQAPPSQTPALDNPTLATPPLATVAGNPDSAANGHHGWLLGIAGGVALLLVGGLIAWRFVLLRRRPRVMAVAIPLNRPPAGR